MPEGDFRPTTVGIIGGLGRMGRWLTARLGQVGCRVLVADARMGPLDPELVRSCPVLVLAVPVPAVEEVMAALGPHTRADGLVMDIASLKERPLASMLHHARGQVVGCHPLFGPGAPSALDQVVFLCRGRGEGALAWARGLWQALGARVVEIEPQTHDRLMARVQVLRHLLLFTLGRGLMRLGFDAQTEAPLAGPWFNELLGLLRHQAEQPAELYADLALHNPHGYEAAQALDQSLQELAHCLGQGDRQGLVDLMGEIVAYAQGMKTGQEGVRSPISGLTEGPA